MTTDSPRSNAPARIGRIECTLHTDPRLIAAVGTIVANAAQRAELPESAQAELGAAVVEACREMFPNIKNDGNAAGAIRVGVTDFTDRVEVAIDAAEKTPVSVKPGVGICKPLQDLKVERTRCEAGEGRVRLTLVKLCGEAKSSQSA